MSTLPVRADQTATLPDPSATWRRKFVEDVLPFLTSLVLHLTIIAVGILTYKAITHIVQPPISIPPTVLPGEVITQSGSDLSQLLKGLPTENDEGPTTTDNRLAPPDDGVSSSPAKLLTLAGGGPSDNSADDAIAIGLHSTFGGKGKTLGSGTGDATGAGEGGGPLAPYGKGQIGRGTPFVGIPGDARRIVYLCDATGTMMGVFDDLRVELRKAVDGLKPSQLFNVVFFSNDSHTSLDKTELVAALPEWKRKTYAFLDQSVPHGSTNPIPAIRASFAMNPQLIYILTDGFDAVSSYQEVVDEFRKLNKDKKVRVNAIMVQSSTDPELEKVLKTIADENGGIFKIVRRDELGGQK